MTTALDVLRKELEDQIILHRDAMAWGQIEDFLEYKRQVGIITGLSAALERVKDLQKYEEEL